MTRGRRKDLTIPPSRALLQQRDYRARKAQYVADLEDRCRKAEAENAELRKDVADLKRRLSQVPVGPSGVNTELARASSDLMQQLTAAASSLARFQQTAFSTSENPASSMNSAPSSSPIPLPPASSLLSLSALPLISPPSTIRQTSSYSPPSHTATPQSLPPLNLPRLQDTQHSSVHLPRLHSADNLPFTSSTNQTSASSTGRRYTNPPPPSLHAHLTHQSLRHSHQSVAHSGIDSPPPASVPKLTPSRWDEFNDPRCCAGYFDCRRAAEGSDHDRSDYDSDDDMEGSAGNVSPTSSNASGGSQIVPLTSDVRSMKE